MTSKSEIQSQGIEVHRRGIPGFASLLILLLVIGGWTPACFGQSNDKIPRVTVINPVQQTLVYRLPAKPAEILAAQEAVIYARTSG